MLSSTTRNLRVVLTSPTLENAWKLADHFGVTIDYLVGRSDKRG